MKLSASPLRSSWGCGFLILLKIIFYRIYDFYVMQHETVMTFSLLTFVSKTTSRLFFAIAVSAGSFLIRGPDIIREL